VGGLRSRGAATPPPAVLPAAFEETVLADFGAGKAALSVNGTVVHEPVPDPAGLRTSVLKVSYPAYAKGEAEWPALKLPATALSRADWRGQDLLVLRIYNPDHEAVDIGLFVREGEARHGPHALLQPNVWNTVMFPLADFTAQKLPLEKIEEVHVFMTRPARALSVYLSTLALLKERDLKAVEFPLCLAVAGFEDEDDLRCWQANGITARLTAAARLGGTRAAELVFPAYQPGAPRWPSYQARYGERALPLRDWSGYSRFCFEARNPGKDEAPLKLCFRDLAGAQATVPATVPARGRLAFAAPLGDLGLDLSRVVQVDLFMSEPAAAHTVWVDDLRLEAAPFAPADRLSDRLDHAGQDATTCAATELATAYRQTREVVAAMRAGFTQKPTFGGARLLAEGVVAATRQTDRLDRDLQVARLLAATRSRVASAAFGVGLADSMTKVMIREQPLTGVLPAERVELELARNEWESFQIVVTGAAQALARVRVEPGTFRHAASAQELPAGVITSSLVGFVQTRKPPYPVPYVGWWPDPILDFQTESALQPGEVVPFWVRVHLPKDAAAGRYEGTVVVRAEGCAEVAVPVILRVFDFTLPDLSFLPTACSFYDNIKALWGKEMSADEYQRRLTEATGFLARYKIGLDHIYRQPKEDPAALDLPVAQLRLLKERGLLRRFMIFHVATPREVTSVDHPAVQKTIDLCLRNLEYWVPRLQQEGLLEFAYLYGYDEVPAPVFPVIAKVFGAIKDAYPAIPLMTTAYDDSFGLKTGLAGKVDWWVPLTPKFAPERVAEARAHGMDVWWYICIGPKHPYCNWLIEYPAIEARLLMGAMTAKYRPGGFLYYALTRWPVNKAPLTQGPYTDWDPMSFKDNNGDGSLFCAGPTGLLATVRAENFRDGMEDNDYFVLLRQLAERAGALPRPTQALQRALLQARKAMEVPADVVVSLQEYSRDPTALRAMRRQVAEGIEALQAALR
jgi:hypothetical protein